VIDPSAARRSVRRVSFARLISLAGSGAAYAALAFMMFTLTGGSSAWVSATLLLTIGVQGFVQPVASWLGDRFDRRRLLVTVDLCAAAGFCVLAFMREPVWLLIVACVTAVIESPIWAVSSSVIPNLVDEGDLAWANGQIAVGRNIGNLVGPLAGGTLVALLAPGDPPTHDALYRAGLIIFLANAASFAVSAWLMATAPGRFSEDRRGGAEHQGIRAGAVFALHDGVLRPVILAWAVVLLGAGFILVAEVAMADLFGQGAFGYGLLTALFGGGAVLGSYLGGRFLSTRREPVALLVSVAATAVAFLLIAVSPWWPLVLVAMMAGGAVEGYGSVAEQGVFQRRTPDAVRSRVNGFVETTVLVSLAVGFGMAGPVVDAFGPRSAYVIGAAGGLIGFLVMLPGMRLLLGRAPSD